MSGKHTGVVSGLGTNRKMAGAAAGGGGGGFDEYGPTYLWQLAPLSWNWKHVAVEQGFFRIIKYQGGGGGGGPKPPPSLPQTPSPPPPPHSNSAKVQFCGF